MGEIIASYNPNYRPPSGQWTKIPLFSHSQSEIRIKVAKWSKAANYILKILSSSDDSPFWRKRIAALKWRYFKMMQV